MKFVSKWYQFFQDLFPFYPESFTVRVDYLEIPGDRMWDYSFIKERLPSVVERDQRPGQPQDQYWWAGKQGEVATYWYAYQSRWIPIDRFGRTQAKTFAAALFEASRHWSFALHFNKGQAGASAGHSGEIRRRR